MDDGEKNEWKKQIGLIACASVNNWDEWVN